MGCVRYAQMSVEFHMSATGDESVNNFRAVLTSIEDRYEPL
jgi:hypothetical protein